MACQSYHASKPWLCKPERPQQQTFSEETRLDESLRLMEKDIEGTDEAYEKLVKKDKAVTESHLRELAIYELHCKAHPGSRPLALMHQQVSAKLACTCPPSWVMKLLHGSSESEFDSQTIEGYVQVGKCSTCAPS